MQLKYVNMKSKRNQNFVAFTRFYVNYRTKYYPINIILFQAKIKNPIFKNYKNT